MYLYLKSVVVAVIEGLTEFLPISSTGHMILAEEFLTLSQHRQFVDAFIIIIQLPAVCAVAVYFRNELWPFLREPVERAQRLALWARVCVAFLPAVILGVLFDDLIEAYLLAPIPVSGALVAGGIAFILLEARARDHGIETIREIGYGRALAIGLLQCLGMFPGVSRSGASIFGAMALGVARPTATKFSFFLAIPTMVGATGYTLLKTGFVFTGNEWLALTIGSVVSFGVAYGVVAFLMRYVQRHTFTGFGIYRIVFGVLMLVYFCWLR